MTTDCGDKSVWHLPDNTHRIKCFLAGRRCAFLINKIHRPSLWHRVRKEFWSKRAVIRVLRPFSSRGPLRSSIQAIYCQHSEAQAPPWSLDDDTRSYVRAQVVILHISITNTHIRARTNSHFPTLRSLSLSLSLARSLDSQLSVLPFFIYFSASSSQLILLTLCHTTLANSWSFALFHLQLFFVHKSLNPRMPQQRYITQHTLYFRHQFFYVTMES